MATPTPSSGSLARKAHAQVFGILLLGLLAAAGLGFSGYQVYQISSAMNQYAEFAVSRTEAQNLLNEMEISFTRFLLDGNAANLALLQRDRESVEQLAQRDPARKDPSIQNMVAQEKRWYAQVAQPLIEQRRNLPAGQGLSEDFLARYRAAGTGLALVNPEVSQGDASGGITESHGWSVQYVQVRLRVWLSVGYLAAAILVALGVCWLAWGAFKNIAGLRKVPQASTGRLS